MREYLIATPGYVHYCGGIVALHHLAHKLNEKGYKAYVTGTHKNPEYNTHYAKDLTQEHLRDLQHNGIIVYPDIVPHNPCRFTHAVKWWLGNTQPTSPNQLTFAFCESHQTLGHRYEDVFYYPPDIEPFFTPPEVENRNGICTYSGKGNGMGERPVPETGHFHTPVPGCSIIQAGNPPTRRGLAELFQRSEVLYCYDNMSIIAIEARLCGTPVIMCGYNVVSKENFEKSEYSLLGLGAYDDKPDIQKLKDEIPEFIESYKQRNLEKEKGLDIFIEKTQAWNPDNIYVDDPHPITPEDPGSPHAHKIYQHQNFELFKTR